MKHEGKEVGAIHCGRIRLKSTLFKRPLHLDNPSGHAHTNPPRFESTYMSEYLHPGHTKISLHGGGVGVPSPDAVEKRAREIAMIAERNPDEFTDADWEQARRELLGTEAHTAPEETEENAEVVEEWNVVASSTGHRAPRVEDGDENLGEQLVSDGIEEAVHDQMLEARREELEQEG
jgi:hypothetical protein